MRERFEEEENLTALGYDVAVIDVAQKEVAGKALWDGIISVPFIKDDPVLPPYILKVIKKEALRHFSWAFYGIGPAPVITLCTSGSLK